MPSSRDALAGPTYAGGEVTERLLARAVFEASWERRLEDQSLRWEIFGDSLFGYPNIEVGVDVAWWRERVHPDDRVRLERSFADAIERKAAAWSAEYRFRRKEGAWAWVWSRGLIEPD